MKTFLKTILFVCLSAGVALSNPVKLTNKPTSFNIGMYNVQHSHVLKLFVEKQKGSDLKIEIKDKDGAILLTKFIDKRDVKSSMSLDISQLTEGNYTLEVSNSTEKFVQELNLSTTQSVVNDKKILL
jgi:hypothetical protein